MRKRRLRIATSVATILAVLAAIFGVATPTAQADTWPDAYTQIINHQIPVQSDGSPTYMFGDRDFGRYYVGTNGLEMRFTSGGTGTVVTAALAIGSAGASELLVGNISGVGAMIISAVRSEGLRKALSLVGIGAGAYVGYEANALVYKNYCLGVTLRSSVLDQVLYKSTQILLGSYLASKVATPAYDPVVWFEPCAASGNADRFAPVSLPGIAGVVAAQPMQAPSPDVAPFGSLDEAKQVPDQTKISVAGWAIDPDAGTGPIQVHTYIDGLLQGAATAIGPRPDVGAAFPNYGANHAYYAEYTVGIGNHQVCTYGIDVGGGVNPQLPNCKMVQVSFAPASFQRSNGETVVVSVGPNNRLDFYYNTYGQPTFNRIPATPDNTVFSAPAIIQRPNGETDIVVMGPNHRLDFYYNVFGTSTFTRLAVTGDNMAYSAPSIVQRANGESDVVVRGPNNSLDFYYNVFGQQTFNRLTAGPDTAFSAPAIIQRGSNGESDLVVQGPNHRLDFYYNVFGTSAFNRLVVAGDGMAFSSPVIVQRTNGESDVAVRGPGDSLDFYYNVFGQPNFTRLTAGGGTAYSTPALVQRDNGESDLAVLGPNGRPDFYFNVFGTSTFTRLNVNGDFTATSAPTLMQRPDKESDIVVAGPGPNYDFYYNAFGQQTFGHVPVAG
ncbi:hypothetical protein ACWEGE_15690 [Amycolatopsis sp. NPDC004747]